MSDNNYFDESVKAYEQAKAIYEELDDLDGQALALISLGDAYRARFESVYRGTISPPPPPRPRPRPVIPRLKVLEGLENAKIAYREAIEVYTDNNNRSGEAATLLRMGDVHLIQSFEHIDDPEIVSSEES
ncbi:MAG: hypothetical protein AAF821_07215 [Cyanobacteria bacterium P01_D01_bin.156]